jgi:hypothetical protein
MDNEKSFRLSLDFEGQHYEGSVTPSEEKGSDGKPVYFRVTLGDTFFAYLCCGDYGWKERDGEGRQKGLIDAIGNYILEYYE